MQVDMFFLKSLPARLIDYFTMALHTCDTRLYARIAHRESPQNGETVAVKCPIHKSLRWMLCWSLGGPFFQRPNQTLCFWNCCLTVESSKQLKWTPNALRNICSFPNKKRWWVARVFIFNMVQYWCVFHSLMLLWTWNQWHRLRIAHVQRQFHPGETLPQHNTVNAKESKQDPICLAGDHGAIAEQSWKLYSKTTWKISITFGGSGLFFRWKQN